MQANNTHRPTDFHTSAATRVRAMLDIIMSVTSHLVSCKQRRAAASVSLLACYLIQCDVELDTCGDAWSQCVGDCAKLVDDRAKNDCARAEQCDTRRSARFFF